MKATIDNEPIEPDCVRRAEALASIINTNAATRAARKAELDELALDAALAEKDPIKGQAALEDHARISALLQIAERALSGASEKANALAGEILREADPFMRTIIDGNTKNIEAARSFARQQLRGFFDENHIHAAVMISQVFLDEVAFAGSHQPPTATGCNHYARPGGTEIVECRSLATVIGYYRAARKAAGEVQQRTAQLAKTLR